MMQISDWVLIWSTITLAVTALIAPHVYDWVKRKWFAPKLEIEFSHEPRRIVGFCVGLPF